MSLRKEKLRASIAYSCEQLEKRLLLSTVPLTIGQNFDGRLGR